MRQRASSSAPKAVKKILVLALDEKNAAGAGNVEKQLQQDIGATTLLINLFTYMPTPNSLFSFSPAAIKSLSDKIAAFSPNTIYLCTHGKFEDVKYCYYSKFTTVPGDQMKSLCTAEELGTLLSQVLPKQPQMELVMCFGARTADYTRNHIEDIQKRNIFDSFAYRLFMKLVLSKIFRQITMNGWVTEVRYERGKMQPEHEDTYILRQKKDLIIEKKNTLHKQMKKLTPGRDDALLMALIEKDLELLEGENKIENHIADIRPKMVYGNMQYAFKDDQCTISFHHGSITKTLYQGPLRVQIPKIDPVSQLISNHPYYTTAAGLLVMGGLFYAIKQYGGDISDETLEDELNRNILQ